MPFPPSIRRASAMVAIAAVASGAALLALPGAALAASAADEPGAASAGVVVNEIVYDAATHGTVDSIELFNASSGAVDVSGWAVMDDKRTERGTIPAGTTLAAGAHLVLAKDAAPLGFPFGLGKGDEVVLVDAADAVVDAYAYAATALLADWSRCADGGEWAPATAVTLGAANVCDEPEQPAEPGTVVLNEVDSGPADWIELINPGTAAVDLGGFEVRDNSDDHRWFFAAGASIAAGERLVVTASTVGADAAGAALEFQAAIGIGGSDAIRVFDAAGTLVDEYAWNGHAAIDGDEAAASYARCPDVTGGFALARVTPGAANDCVLPSVAINEVESNGDATDWVEVVNTGATPVDLSGWTLMDGDPVGHAGDVVPVASGTVLAPGARFVFDGATHFSFGLGAADVATIRTASGLAVAEYAWTAHAAVTWARCPDGTGAFGDATTSTKGAANACGGPIDPTDPGHEVVAWPGSEQVTVVDEAAMFLSDSSGLDTQQTADGVVLWAVDNGTGTFWKLDASADGGVAFADGWSDGKRVRFQRDAANPASAGPDAEGITAADDGRVYIASERDNANKGVNQNTILAVDPEAAGPDVVAAQEWDLTASLPQVAANTGLEAVEWVADAALTGLVDAKTGTAYDPADYPGHGGGLFFLAVEDDGMVYAYALNADGSYAQVAAIDPGLGGVMALDYDTVLGTLWAVCDNGCEGEAARITLTGADPEIVHVARPAGMPNLNSEGFATAPASLSTASPAVALSSASPAASPTTTRPVWWFADGEQPAALRTGTLPGAVPTDPTDPGTEEPGTGEPGTEEPGTDEPGTDEPGGGADTAASGASGGLAHTGAEPWAALSVAGVLLALGGAAWVIALRRRRAHGAA